MQKLLLLFLLFVSATAFSDNDLTQLINKSKYDQVFCGKKLSHKERIYLQNTMAHSIDYCVKDDSLTLRYKNDFEQLLAKAKNQPEKYGFYVATAYMLGMGVDRSSKLAGHWMQKSAEAGNLDAIYAYYIFELEGGSESCNQQVDNCIEQIYKDLKKINTAKAYEILSFYTRDPKLQCAYNKKAVELGSIDAYTAYVSCYQELEKKPMTQKMRMRLNQIFSDTSTSIYTKAAAANLLGKKKEAELLYRAVQ